MKPPSTGIVPETRLRKTVTWTLLALSMLPLLGPCLYLWSLQGKELSFSAILVPLGIALSLMLSTAICGLLALLAAILSRGSGRRILGTVLACIELSIALILFMLLLMLRMRI